MAQLPLEQGLVVLQGRAKVLRVLLWIYIAVSAGAAATSAAIFALGGEAGADSRQPLVAMDGFLSLGWVLAFLACAITAGMWIYRAHANLFAAGFEGLEFKPGWSIGWFFVPIAGLFKPFQAMRELWNASHLVSDGFSAPADSRLSVWWAFWITGNVAFNASFRLRDLGAGVAVLDVAAHILIAAAAWCLLRIVEAVTTAQSAEMSASYAFA